MNQAENVVGNEGEAVSALSKEQATNLTQSWLSSLEAALNSSDLRKAAALIHPEGYWRDLLALTWKLQTFQGTVGIEKGLAEARNRKEVRNIVLTGEAFEGHLGTHGPTLDAFFTFETHLATGRGFVRLVRTSNSGEFKALTLLTAMWCFKKFPEVWGRNRDKTFMRAIERGTANWLERRAEEVRYQGRSPQVIVIGAGQAGLMLAARLKRLNVDTLVVEKNPRVGDVWRKRYHSLTLHNEICTNHFPYIPFPDSWPVYIPKDKLANWMEFYADSMELNIWTNTRLIQAEYNETEHQWTVELATQDGTRILRPSHVVMATGVNGSPNIPTVDGTDDFIGTIAHSSGETDTFEVTGKSALVVGAGTSGHDIAQDLFLRGASVTMLQRSSTTVVSIDPSSVKAYQLYRQYEGIRAIDDIDLISAAIPYDLVRRLHGPLSRQMAEDDRELLDRLRAVGFALDNGEDDTGFFMKLLRRLSGYYLNVGASDLIADRKIGLKSGVQLERLTATEAVFSDGSRLGIDILIFATGYRPLQETVEDLFGAEVAERVGPIWGIGEDGELRNMFGPTHQPGFYIAGGTLTMCRSFSRYTALRIKAELEGFVERSD